MYRIAVLTDLKHEGEHYAKVINDYCINQKLFHYLKLIRIRKFFLKRYKHMYQILYFLYYLE